MNSIDLLGGDHHAPLGAAAGVPSSQSPAAPPASADPVAVYRIDFDVDHLGKNKPASKRRAVWRYGLPTAAGAPIVSHEAMLTWSTHSGKYTISMDGVEVFAGVAKGSVLEYKWTWSHARARVVADEEGDEDGDGVTLRIIACRKPPVRSIKNFRCYEFLVGEKVFRDLPTQDSNEYVGGFTSEDTCDNGKLASILDIVEPGWRASGFA